MPRHHTSAFPHSFPWQWLLDGRPSTETITDGTFILKGHVSPSSLSHGFSLLWIFTIFSQSTMTLFSSTVRVWTSKANRPAEQSVHQRGSSKCPTLLCNRDVKQNILQVRFGSFVSGCRNELWCSHLHLSVFTIVQKVFYSKFTGCVKVFMCKILNSFFLNELLLANVPNMILKPTNLASITSVRS